MATSELKRRANRANANKSTGPRSAKGKAAVRMNALKHGIFSSETFIATGEGAEEREEFDALRDGMVADLKPQGALEQLLVDELVAIAWRLRRLYRYELGATRASADEAVADWTRRQQRVHERSVHHARDFPNASPDDWKSTESLERELDQAQRALRELEAAAPLAAPGPGLVVLVADYAALLQRDPGDLRDLAERGVVDRDRVRALVAELGGDEQSEREVVAGLRRWVELEADKLEAELGRRRRQEERLALQAALPCGSDLEKVVRYEAHLSRRFDRALRQLEARRAPLE